MTEKEVKSYMRSELYLRYKNIAAAAKDVGMSGASIGAMINGSDTPSKKLLDFFGMKKEIVYSKNTDWH